MSRYRDPNKPRRKPGPKGYPDSLKARAIALANEVGPVAAANSLGIGASTIVDWTDHELHPTSLQLSVEDRLAVAQSVEKIMAKRILQAHDSAFDIKSARDFRDTMVGIGIARDVSMDYREGRRKPEASDNRSVVIIAPNYPDIAATHNNT